MNDTTQATRPVATDITSEAVWQFKKMLSDLYPGFDRQALDAVIRALQDRYGSPVRQVEIAVERAVAVAAPPVATDAERERLADHMEGLVADIVDAAYCSGLAVGENDDLNDQKHSRRLDYARDKLLAIILGLRAPVAREGTDVGGALRQAAEWFREYERIHMAKPDYDFGKTAEKVKRNRERAEFCEAALRRALSGEQRSEPISRAETLARASEIMHRAEAERLPAEQRSSQGEPDAWGADMLDLLERFGVAYMDWIAEERTEGAAGPAWSAMDEARQAVMRYAASYRVPPASSQPATRRIEEWGAADGQAFLQAQTGSQGDGWRDIASAPRDGRRVLAWWGTHGDDDVRLVLYHEGEWYEYGDAMDPDNVLVTPTHWRALPAPPAPGALASGTGHDATCYAEKGPDSPEVGTGPAGASSAPLLASGETDE